MSAYRTSPVMKHCARYEMRVEKTLAKRASETKKLLLRVISIHNTINKKEASERVEDLVKIIKFKLLPSPSDQHNHPNKLG